MTLAATIDAFGATERAIITHGLARAFATASSVHIHISSGASVLLSAGIDFAAHAAALAAVQIINAVNVSFITTAWLNSSFVSPAPAFACPHHVGMRELL